VLFYAFGYVNGIARVKRAVAAAKDVDVEHDAITHSALLWGRARLRQRKLSFKKALAEN